MYIYTYSFFFAVCVVIGMFHHHQAGHTIDFANKKILGEEKCNWRRLIMEGLEIKKLPATERADMQSG